MVVADMEVAGQGDLHGPHAGKMMEGLVPRKEGKKPPGNETS